MRYFVVGDEDTVLGFGMAGVSGTAVGSARDAESALAEAIADRSIGIIIITERVADMVRPTVDKFIFTRQFPLIVEIPDRRGVVAGRPSVREMINAAIGIKL
jgi:V/A-type H+-transporting ATPase subunit F